jgi:Glycosyltransferase family 9 (heptosyltransferase)
MSRCTRTPDRGYALKRLYIAPVSFGLGDLVVCLPVLQGSIAQSVTNGSETWLVARSPSQAQLAARITGLAGCVDDAWNAFEPGDRLVDLRDHPLQRDHWWGSPEFEQAFGALSINDIVARIASDAGLDADFSAPVPLAAWPRPTVAGSVLFVVATDGPAKLWPAERWRALASMLHARGENVGVVTRDETADELGLPGIETIRAPTLGDAVDVLTAARAVVGVDTGLTHLAVQQGTPTVTICRARCVYFRPWPHTGVVRGSECDETCLTIEREYAYNARVDLRDFDWEPRVCPVASRCLAAVEPGDVVSALEELL